MQGEPFEEQVTLCFGRPFQLGEVGPGPLGVYAGPG